MPVVHSRPEVVSTRHSTMVDPSPSLPKPLSPLEHVFLVNKSMRNKTTTTITVRLSFSSRTLLAVRVSNYSSFSALSLSLSLYHIPDGNNNGNNGNYEVNEICQQSYEMAAKCEKGLSNINYFYPDTTGCDYINTVLPRLEKATRNISSLSGVSTSTGGTAATAFAVVFAVTTLILGAYAFFLYRKIHRAKVNLAQAEMGMS